MEDPKGLCHRCEHRARFYENGSAPRCECAGKSNNLENITIQLEKTKGLFGEDFAKAIDEIKKQILASQRQSAVCGCYMYTPVVPFALEPSNPQDKRSILLPALLAGRSRAAFLPRIHYQHEEGDTGGQVAMGAFEIDKAIVKMWVPVDIEEVIIKNCKKKLEVKTKEAKKLVKKIKSKKKTVKEAHRELNKLAIKKLKNKGKV